jgi:YggT family protein
MMLLQILALILDTATSLVGGACLLRLFMQHQRVPFSNPVGRFVFAVSDWLVLPMRKIVPAIGRWDTASLLATWVLKLAQIVVLSVLSTGVRNAPAWPILATLAVAQLMILAATVLLIAHVVLSWVQPRTPVADLVTRLVAPVLHPLRRLLPPLGGVDLSPLLAVLLLQIGSLVLDGVARSLAA